jgi:transcriptional regulator with XRE-family HTH domain
MPKRAEHQNLYESLGQTISERRRRLNLTQDELAERSGVNRAFISNIERGSRNPSIGAVASLAQALGMRPSKLLALSETPRRSA